MRRIVGLSVMACGAAVLLAACSSPEGSTVQIVDPPAPQAAELVLPEVPDVPVVEDIALPEPQSAVPVVVPEQQAAVTPKVVKSAKPRVTVTTPTPTPTPSVPVKSEPTASPAVSQAGATELVLASVGEGSVKETVAVQHQGYDAYKVSVLLPTGGVIVGYVDTVSGVIFDWEQTSPPPVVTTPAPAPVNTPAAAGYDDDGEHEDEHHEDGEHEDEHHDEHEGDDD